MEGMHQYGKDIKILEKFSHPRAHSITSCDSNSHSNPERQNLAVSSGR